MTDNEVKPVVRVTYAAVATRLTLSRGVYRATFAQAKPQP